MIKEEIIVKLNYDNNGKEVTEQSDNDTLLKSSNSSSSSDNGGQNQLNILLHTEPTIKKQKISKSKKKEEDLISETSISQFSESSNNDNKHLISNAYKEDLVGKMIDEIGMSNYQFKIILFGLFMTFSYGAEIVVVSLITRKLEKIWHLTDMKKASLGGALFYGFLLGALFSGNLMNSKGRKFCFTIGGWLFIFFGISSAFSNEFYSFMFYRTGVGVGLGLMIPTTLTFITEMSPSKYRGFNCNIIWLGYSMGELFICFIAKYFPLDNKFSQQSNWTIVIIFASLPILINLFIMNFIHESPRYSLSHQHFEEGFTTLQEMREDADLPELTNEERQHIIKFYEKTKQQKQKSNFLKLFNETHIHITIKLFFLTSIISFLFFALLYIIPELIGKTIENVNFHDLVRTVVYATVFETFGVLCAFMMEINSIGRLGALKISFVISFICAFLCLITTDMHKSSICLFVLKGAVTVAHRVLIVYLPECYPTDIRGQALGVSQSLSKILGIATPIICQILLSFSVTSMIFALVSICFLGVCLAYTINKETLNTKID